METSDFDKLIQQKLNEPNPLHKQEMELAKPTIWFAITTKKKAIWIPWAAAAAVIICVLLLPVYYYQHLKKDYANSLQQLKIELNQNIRAEKNLVTAIELNEKEQLCSEIDKLKNELNALKKNQIVNNSTPLPIQTKIVEEIVYLRDTVYLDSRTTDPVTQQLANETTFQKPIEPTENGNEVSELIYPDYKPSKTAAKQDQSPLKIIINPFKN